MKKVFLWVFILLFYGLILLLPSGIYDVDSKAAVQDVVKVEASSESTFEDTTAVKENEEDYSTVYLILLIFVFLLKVTREEDNM